jgi:uncharacterized membrane protein YphA (DoxX/SURF4 family)
VDERVLTSARIALLFRIIVGLVFIFAAVPKIGDPFGFSINIRNYHLLPASLTNIAAIVLPWIELYAGLFIILGIYIRACSFLFMLLLGVFIFAIASAMWRGFDISCGCFYISQDMAKVGIQRIIEDVLLFVMALQIYIVNAHASILNIRALFTKT